MSLNSTESTTTNQSPLLAIPISPKNVYENQFFAFTIPDYTFADQGDSLTYNANLADGSPLPSWLSFDPETLTFSGIPTGVNNLNLTITATDSAGNAVSDTFVISIATAVAFINNGYFASDIEIVDDYAYVAGGDAGLQIFNISNPNTPTMVGSYDTSGSTRDVAIVNNYAYVVNGDEGLLIFDISNPSSPTVIGSYDTPGYANGITVVGNYAYIADWNAGVQIIDISNPTDPTLISNYILVSNDNFLGVANSVIVKGDYAYVTDINYGLHILNISNVNAPTLVHHYQPYGSVFGLAIEGNYAYIVNNLQGLQILDISNPYAPILISSFDIPDIYTSWTKGIKIVGDYAYITTYESGVQILDISNPYAPTFVNSYDTEAASDLAVIGDYIYVVDSYNLKVLYRGNWDGTPNNTAPMLANEIASQTAYQNQAFSFTIPNYTFADPGDNLSYNVSLGDGSPVPSWLNFNSATRTLSGTPRETGSLNITITATDSTDKSVSDTILLSVLAGGENTVGAAYDVAIAGNYAYVANWYSGVQILNISNPNSPTSLGSYDTFGQAYGIAVAGNYAYVADGDAGLTILNISNPDAPFSVASYDTSGTANSVAVVGNYGYIADGDGGVQIIDISNPYSPSLVISIDTPGSAEDITVEGGYAYVADSWGGSADY